MSSKKEDQKSTLAVLKLKKRAVRKDGKNAKTIEPEITFVDGIPVEDHENANEQKQNLALKEDLSMSLELESSLSSPRPKIAQKKLKIAEPEITEPTLTARSFEAHDETVAEFQASLPELTAKNEPKEKKVPKKKASGKVILLIVVILFLFAAVFIGIRIFQNNPEYIFSHNKPFYEFSFQQEDLAWNLGCAKRSDDYLCQTSAGFYQYLFESIDSNAAQQAAETCYFSLQIDDLNRTEKMNCSGIFGQANGIDYSFTQQCNYSFAQNDSTVTCEQSTTATLVNHGTVLDSMLDETTFNYRADELQVVETSAGSVEAYRFRLRTESLELLHFSPTHGMFVKHETRDGNLIMELVFQETEQGTFGTSSFRSR